QPVRHRAALRLARRPRHGLRAPDGGGDASDARAGPPVRRPRHRDPRPPALPRRPVLATRRDEGRSEMLSKPGTPAVGSLATAMLMLDIAVVNTALPHIAADLHAGLSGVQWVVDAYTLALAAAVLSAGSLADRFGRRRIFVLGLGLFTISSLACALARSIAVLDGARAVQGTAAAMLFASSLAVLADAFPGAAERAQAFALYGATIGATFAVGPLVGGALTSAFGWQAVFYVNVPLGILALAASFVWLRESNDPAAPRLDWP